MDQHGSRFIQQKLVGLSEEEILWIFEEVLPTAHALMTDVFGNYVMQKLLEHPVPRATFLELFESQVLSLSLQMYGCRIVQKALEELDEASQMRIVAQLDGSIPRCVRDQNGNHVVQKCIEVLAPERLSPIISIFCGNVLSLATHMYGCRVLQRILEHGLARPNSRFEHGPMLMEEILGYVDQLAQQQYGNYVVQHVLEYGNDDHRRRVLGTLSGRFVELSKHKFASNVVEKALQFCDPTNRQIVLDELLTTETLNPGPDPLELLLNDQYGNYVAQKLLDVCQEPQRFHLLQRMRAHLPTLRKFTYGKHIVTRVEKLIAAGAGGY